MHNERACTFDVEDVFRAASNKMSAASHPTVYRLVHTLKDGSQKQSKTSKTVQTDMENDTVGKDEKGYGKF